jgi:hypothetical protein
LPGWQCPEDASGKIRHHCHLWTDPKHPKPSFTSRVAQALGSSCLQENKNLSHWCCRENKSPFNCKRGQETSQGPATSMQVPKK